MSINYPDVISLICGVYIWKKKRRSVCDFALYGPFWCSLEDQDKFSAPYSNKINERTLKTSELFGWNRRNWNFILIIVIIQNNQHKWICRKLDETDIVSTESKYPFLYVESTNALRSQEEVIILSETRCLRMKNGNGYCKVQHRNPVIFNLKGQKVHD